MKIDICDRAMKIFFLFFFLISYVVLVVGCYLYVNNTGNRTWSEKKRGRY